MERTTKRSLATDIRWAASYVVPVAAALMLLVVLRAVIGRWPTGADFGPWRSVGYYCGMALIVTLVVGVLRPLLDRPGGFGLVGAVCDAVIFPVVGAVMFPDETFVGLGTLISVLFGAVAGGIIGGAVAMRNYMDSG